MTQLGSIPGFQWLDLRLISLISERLSFLNHCNESQNFDTWKGGYYDYSVLCL